MSKINNSKMKYIFFVRPWFLKFFELLEKKISLNGDAEVIYYTMNRSCYNKLKKKNKTVYYLPDEFKSVDISNNYDVFKNVEKELIDKYGFGFNFLYEMERFKPRSYKSNNFILSHVIWLYNNVPDDSKMIFLSCDHFIFFISSYINRLKNGENYFIQPVGFPKQAQVMMESPFELKKVREAPLNEDYLYEYIDSLKEDPMSSIHYMKPKKKISLLKSLRYQFKDIFKRNEKTDIFSYLELERKSIIPSRFTQKNKIAYDLNYLSIEDVVSINQETKLFYFPLQYEPEMSILAYSPFFKDQIEVIRLIHQSLNQNDVLLLKENPKMIGKRGDSFYDEISKFHQVKWADSKVNSREIIRNCHKVVSITGTATIEAACLGVNSMIFGYPPFRKLLLQKPISDEPISMFRELLYKVYHGDEIVKHLKQNWPEYSKSVHFGDYTNRWVDGQKTTLNTHELVNNFYREVLA